jgi:phospho-N-acetylmuramoyl-pentapeptide-transferase
MGWKSVQFACGFGASFLIVMFCGRWFINKMGDWQKKGQPIREDGPQTHLVKAGTPTMGGVLILAAVLVSSLLFMDYHNPIGWIALASLVLFGAVGFSDDLGKVKKQSAYSGMSARGRLALEFLIAAALAFLIDKTMPMYVPNLSLVIPGVHVIWGLGVFYFLFAYIVIAGSANAANITDGLDGMLSKTILPVIAVLGVALYGATHLNIIWNGLVFLPEAVVLYPIMGAVVGAVLGFLWFNAAPASIFMGDVGSLALGGFMGTVAMILKAEIIMGIAALMMVTILASSFVQTTVFKLTKRGARPGRRIFKMAPLHHHFELCGWAETKVVERFLILSVLFSGLALIVMKI